MNRVLLCGRLGQDPEVRFIGSGKAVCTLSLATDERWTDSSGTKQQRTEWHRVEVWGKQAEACGQYLAKGRHVLVEGALRTRTYEKNGETRSVTEVVAQRIEFVGSGRTQGNDPGRATGADAPALPAGDDDVPF
jgi:single-strand DNA-binding protein